MRERSRSPRAPRRRRRVGLVTVVLLIVGGWFVLLSILGRRLQRGRQQRLGAEVDAAAPAPSCRPTLPPAPEQPAHPVARYTEHGAPTPAALEADAALWARYKRDIARTRSGRGRSTTTALARGAPRTCRRRSCISTTCVFRVSSIRHRRDGRDSTPHAVLGRADVRLGRRHPRRAPGEDRRVPRRGGARRGRARVDRRP